MMKQEKPPAKDEDVLLRHGDEALQKFGDTAQGANWPSEKDRLTRFDVMLDVMLETPREPVVFCDFACGTGELLRRITERGIPNIEYFGVDRSDTAIELAQNKFPGVPFFRLDIDDPACDASIVACDYLCIDGLFTVKWELGHDAMWAFVQRTVRRLWPHIRKGIAFNAMSKIVDWERDDLFHLPMDDAARLLHSLAGRHVMLRADYGLWEYTAYAFRTNPHLKLVGRAAPDACSVHLGK